MEQQTSTGSTKRYTLTEAIKSGRSFKRESWTSWFHLKGDINDVCEIIGEKGMPFHMLVHNLIAEDWVLEPIKPLEIICEWDRLNGSDIIFPVISGASPAESSKVLKLLVRRRTKITIELLDGT